MQRLVQGLLRCPNKAATGGAFAQPMGAHLGREGRTRMALLAAGQAKEHPLQNGLCRDASILKDLVSGQRHFLTGHRTHPRMADRHPVLALMLIVITSTNMPVTAICRVFSVERGLGM